VSLRVPNLNGSSATEVFKKKKLELRFTNGKIKLGTWNVRGMREGKLTVMLREMERTGLEMLGISELHSTGNGHFDSDGFSIIYFGHQIHKKRGVAFICSKKVAECIIGYDAVNDKIIRIRVRGPQVNTTVIQVYAPTFQAEEDEQEGFYGKLKETIDDIPKGDVIIIMGDFNTKVGSQCTPGIAGPFGLGEKNEAGERLVDLCSGNDLNITNTCYKQHKKRLYTWTMPDGQYKNQIDYMLVGRKCNTICQTYPGADCGTEHELLVAQFRIRLKANKKGKTHMRYNFYKISHQYTKEVSAGLISTTSSDQEPEDMWQGIKTVILTAARNQVPKSEHRHKSAWLSVKAIDIARRRRELKASGGSRESIQRLNADFQRQARRNKEEFLNKLCTKIEANNRAGRTRDLFKTIKEVTGAFNPRQGGIKDISGRSLTDNNAVKRQWKEYTENLYRKTKTLSFSIQVFSV